MSKNKEDAGLLARLTRRSQREQEVSEPEGIAVSADDNRDLLALVTQETRYELIQDVLAHPDKMPSLDELVYANPKKSKSTIRNHLDKLIARDVLETVKLPKEKRSRDLPYKFYRLTGEGRAFLENHGLTRSEETLEQMYEMLEKRPRIQRYADAPRPGDEELDGHSEIEESGSRHDKPDVKA